VSQPCSPRPRRHEERRDDERIIDPGPEVLFAGGYSLLLLIVAVALELAARRTYRYVRMSRSVGFRYIQHIDAWVCSQGDISGSSVVTITGMSPPTGQTRLSANDAR